MTVATKNADARLASGTREQLRYANDSADRTSGFGVALRRVKRALPGVIHFLAYHFILARRRTVVSHAAGLRLAVPPTVFHPRYFRTSEFFAEFIGQLDLAGKRVADVGTGTGILALAAARNGAANALAIDINPNAARAAAENARANGLGDRVSSMCSDLFSAVPPQLRFDVILSNPPFFAGEPLDLADRAWHAGPDCCDIAPIFVQARERLAPGGRMYVVLSSNADLGLFEKLMERAQFTARITARRSLLVESLVIYELRADDIGRPSIVDVVVSRDPRRLPRDQASAVERV